MIRLAGALASSLAMFTFSTSASAGGDRRIETGATLGYAFPAGSLERGSRTSDVTFGAPFLAIEGAYRVHPALSVGAAIGVGIEIPKLCVTSSDCASSLGHDVALGVLGRWHPGSWRAFDPTLALQVGYEWLETSLSDKGVSSSRRYRGWDWGVIAEPMFRVSSRFVLGPSFAVSAGVFQRASLEAPGVADSRSIDGSAVHVWVSIGARLGAAW